MSDTDALIFRIRQWRDARQWSASRLATEAGLSNMALRAMDRPHWNPTVETLRKLEALIPDGGQPGDPVTRGEAA